MASACSEASADVIVRTADVDVGDNGCVALRVVMLLLLAVALVE